MKRRILLAGASALALTPWLTACGGGSDSSTSKLRLLNASRGYAALDLYLDGELESAEIAYGSVGDYVALDDTSLSVGLARAGSTAYASSTSRSLSDGTAYTLLAYGWEGALKLLQLSDEEEAADSGEVALRALNTATDAGTLDVYVTGEGDDLASASPAISSVAGGTSSSYTTLLAGTYRVRVTASGDTDDLRMDVSGVTLGSTSVMSLILVPGTSGVLVTAMLLEQGGTPEVLTTAAARVRSIAAVEGNLAVSVVAGSTALASNGRAPTIGGYKRVEAGSLPLTVIVGGTAVAAANLEAADGADYTVLVHGSADTPEVSVMLDDNRRPTDSGDFRVRLVHGASALAAGGLSMTVNYASVADDVAYAEGSAFDSDTAVTDALIEVTSPLQASAVYTLADVDLAADGVYSVYVLMNGSAPVGLLRKER